jgi:hypothetical protein
MKHPTAKSVNLPITRNCQRPMSMLLSSRSRNAGVGLVTIFVTCALAAFIGFVALQYSTPIIDYQLNADSMYVLMITKDIVFDGGHLADWFTSVHLLIYPDTLLAISIILLYQLGVPVFLGCLAIYGFLLISLTAYAWQRVSGEGIAVSALAGSVLFGLMFLGDNLLYQQLLQQTPSPDLTMALKHTRPVGHILGPALHSGAFILAFALFFPLHYVLTEMKALSSRNALLTGCIFANIILVTLSDLMFVGWGIVPLSMVVASRAGQNSARKTALLLAFLLTCAVLGYLGSSLFSTEQQYLAIAGRPLSEALQGVVNYMLLAASMRQPIITFFFYTNVILWCVGGYFFVRELTSPVSNLGRCLAIFAASMSAASILAPAVAGMFTGEPIRYLIPYLVLGPSFCAFVALLGARRLLSPAPWSACLAAAALTIFVAGSIAWVTLPGPTAHRLYACLKSVGLTSGRADFWDAAPVAIASGWRVKVAPLAPGTLNLFEWLTKRQWLQQDTAESDQIFLILDPHLAEQALIRYGPADTTLPCAGRRILVYKPASRVN